MANTAELEAKLNSLRADRDHKAREYRSAILAVQAQLDVARAREDLDAAEARAAERQAKAEAIINGKVGE